jgi:hypothetical protein
MIEFTTFNEWLDIREGRWRGQVGGAFGNDPQRGQLRKLHQRGQEEVGRGAISGLDQQTRSMAGRSVEALVMKALAEVSGWKIEEATFQQDTQEKIDGWKIEGGGKRIPIQVKFRDSGDDIAAKVEWKGKPGRDLRGNAQLYVVLDRAGLNIRVRSADEVKAIARRMLEEFNAKGRPSSLRLDNGTIRKGYDPHDGAPIVMVYILPDAPGFTYKENFRLPKVIWSYRDRAATA